MQHTPPTTRSQADRMEDRLRGEVRAYRKLLQKISRIKTKILCALRDEGCQEAAEMLQYPAREVGASRCERCVGCYTLRGHGPCQECPECSQQQECVEHTRLCFTWRQPPTTFIAGSVTTGVSSACNAAEYDLTRYKSLMDELGDASLDVESTLDEFPRGSQHHLQDRYNASRRTRDIQYEEEQLRTLETLLLRHQEERVRLDDVLSGDEEEVNDAVEVGGGEGIFSGQAAPFGLMSQTHTHYQFDSPAPAGFEVGPGAEVSTGGLGDHDLWLGLGAGAVDPRVLQSLLRSPERNSSGQSPTRERRSSYQPPGRGSEKQVSGFTVAPSARDPSTTAASATSLSCTTTTVTTTDTRTTPHVAATRAPSATPARKEPERLVSRSTATPSVPSPAPATTSSAPQGCTPPTTGARGTPQVAGCTAGTSPPKLGEMTCGRRRSASNEEQGSRHSRSRDDAKDRLFRVKQLVATRSQILSQDLDLIIARLPDTYDGPTDWVQVEVRMCQQRMTELEELESTAWTEIDQVEGRSSQRLRIEKWRDWLARQTDKTRKIKSWIWGAPAAASGDRVPPDIRPRQIGHVEKVKLPTFSGRQADFTEFRSQFRELCRGERYTPVLEMAQLRTKLPKEALALLVGLQCPEEAWKRMEELYGNRELGYSVCTQTST